MPQGKYTLTQPTQGKYKLPETTTESTPVTSKPVERTIPFKEGTRTTTEKAPTTKETLLNTIPVAGGTAVGLIPGAGILTGGATMAALDRMLRTRYSDDPDEVSTSAGDALFKIGAETLGNITAGKVVEAGIATPGIIKDLAKEYKTPGSVVDRTLTTLGAPYSAYKDSSFARFLEDTFAPLKKFNLFKESQETAERIINKQLVDLALNPVTLDDYTKLAGIAKTTYASNYYAGVKASVAKGNLVQGMADSVEVPIYKQVASPIVAPSGSPPNVTNVLERTVKGPINVIDAITHSKSIVDEITKIPTNDILVNIIADPKYNKLQQTAANILLNSEAQFDTVGKLISHAPISFKNGWQWQKDLGNYAANAFDSGVANYNKKQLWELYGSLGDDISNSIPKWQNQEALSLWQDSKAIAKEYLGSFFPQDAEIQLGKVVLGNEANVADTWNKIISDNHALQKTLNAGELPLAQQAGAGITNPKKELATFKLADIWRNSQIIDDVGNKRFSAARFFKQFNSPEFAQSENFTINSSRDLLYSKGTQDDVRRIATGLEKITSGPGTESRYMIYRASTGVIGLGAGLATSMFTGSLPAGVGTGATIIGVGLSARGLAKWMTDKTAARLLTAIVEKQPLGMPERAAALIIGKAIRNEAVQLWYSDNNNIDGKMDRNGGFAIPLK